MSISELISKLIQFNGTERQVFVKLFVRDKDGNVLSCTKYPVTTAFSHDNAEIYIESDQGESVK
jgi:hypothetical protein